MPERVCAGEMPIANTIHRFFIHLCRWENYVHEVAFMHVGTEKEVPMGRCYALINLHVNGNKYDCDVVSITSVSIRLLLVTDKVSFLSRLSQSNLRQLFGENNFRGCLCWYNFTANLKTKYEEPKFQRFLHR
jgi:hypothetical protein